MSGEAEQPGRPDGSREAVAIGMLIALAGLLVASPFGGWTAWAIMGASVALALYAARATRRSFEKRMAAKEARR